MLFFLQKCVNSHTFYFFQDGGTSFDFTPSMEPPDKLFPTPPFQDAEFVGAGFNKFNMVSNLQPPPQVADIQSIVAALTGMYTCIFYMILELFLQNYSYFYIFF